MTQIPDGWIFIPHMKPNFKDNQAIVDITVDRRELIMCRNCKYWDEERHECENFDIVDPSFDIITWKTAPDWYCADGERQDNE